MNIGIFGIDPGGSSGLAWGIFNPHAPSAAEALQTKIHPGSTTTTGDEHSQIREICSIWSSFYSTCVHVGCLPPDHVHLCCEDFVLKPGATVGGTDSIIPRAIIFGIEGYRMGRRDEWMLHRRGPIHMPAMSLQLPSAASQYATKERMREWGLWVVGREHERSAWAHVALYLKRYMMMLRQKA